MFSYAAPHDYKTHACNCVGPRNGDPVCPCMMGEYNRRKAGELALQILTKMPKPRIRVPAGRGEGWGGLGDA